MRETIRPFAWDRGECLALAQQSCVYCFGLGLRPGRNGASTPCNCVFRAIFRACYRRFLACLQKEKHISRVSIEANQSATRKSVFGMKNEEYVADFCLVAKRALADYQHRVFKFHYLLGADWRLCARRLAINRGEFFHECYRIEQKLGRVFRELEPHPLYPLRAYFGGVVEGRRRPPADFAVYSEAEEAAPPAGKLLAFPLPKAA